MLQTIRTHADFLREQYGVRRIGIIGGGKRGPALDILVELESGFRNFDNYIKLQIFLEALLGCSVDLVPSKALNFYFKRGVFLKVSYI